MARKLRIQYRGTIYHVMNRGDGREPIFKDEADHRRFLATLGETCVKTGWQVHAYCLMSNHFHLVSIATAVIALGCPKHSNVPANNRACWRKKLSGNQARDRLVTRTLRKNGWSVVRVWEQELRQPIRPRSGPNSQGAYRFVNDPTSRE